MFRASLSLLAGLSLAPSALSAPLATTSTLLAAHYTGKLYTLTLSTTGSTGSLTVSQPVTGCGSTPAWLELYPEDKTLYCFDESWTGSGQNAAFSVAADGKLTLKASARTSGNSVHGTLYGGSDGKGFAATAQYSPSTIITYKLPFSGSTQALQTEKFTLSQKGPNSRQDVAHPHETLLDPTGKFLLVPDLGADLIRIFSIDANSGRLTACGQGQASPGDGPRHAKFYSTTSASGSQPNVLFTVNELGNSVSSWNLAYPSGNGGCLTLTRTQTISTFAPGKTGGPNTKAAELRTAGNFLYAANRADQAFGNQKDSIATYSIDPASGKLTWIEAANANAYYPRTFQINKAGTLVAVGGQTSSNVAILNRDPATGKLGSLVASVQVASPGQAGQEDGLAAVIWNE